MTNGHWRIPGVYPEPEWRVPRSSLLFAQVCDKLLFVYREGPAVDLWNRGPITDVALPGSLIGSETQALQYASSARPFPSSSSPRQCHYPKEDP